MSAKTQARKPSILGFASLLALLLTACDQNVDDSTAPQPALRFVEPTSPNSSLPLNTPDAIVVEALQPGPDFAEPGLVPAPNTPVALSASSGNLSAARSTACSYAASSPVESLQLTTGSNGEAVAYICKDGAQGAGGSVLKATADGGKLSASLAGVFVATMPSSISIQASPTTILASGTSSVTTQVTDAYGNPVPNQKVDFDLTDPSGGSLSAPSAETNIAGTATVIYKPNPHFASKSNVNVSIGASIAGTKVGTANPAQIVVAGTALNIIFGTGNQISSPSLVTYAVLYSIAVSDSTGMPVPNLTVDLRIESTAYQKGKWVLTATAPGAWEQMYSVPPGDPDYNISLPGQAVTFLDQLPFGCRTEDPNDAGVYSVALDYNHNGRLDPGQVAGVPFAVQLGSNGTGTFSVTYPKNYAGWVESALMATFGGSTGTAVFVLPIAAADIDNPSVPPPGQLSPYGQADNCADPN